LLHRVDERLSLLLEAAKVLLQVLHASHARLTIRRERSRVDPRAIGLDRDQLLSRLLQ
jgi:hypothetical protein